ncbi:hypothetical protein Tco_0360193, partial [Tanacetum coccineum]
NERNNNDTTQKGHERFDEHKPMNYDDHVSKMDAISFRNNASYFNNEERLNERVCKSEKFNVVKYSLSPNEKCVAISTCEYDTWRRTNDSVSRIFQEFFHKKNEGGLVKRIR